MHASSKTTSHRVGTFFRRRTVTDRARQTHDSVHPPPITTLTNHGRWSLVDVEGCPAALSNLGPPFDSLAHSLTTCVIPSPRRIEVTAFCSFPRNLHSTIIHRFASRHIRNDFYTYHDSCVSSPLQILYKTTKNC